MATSAEYKRMEFCQTATLRPPWYVFHFLARFVQSVKSLSRFSVDASRFLRVGIVTATTVVLLSAMIGAGGFRKHAELERGLHTVRKLNHKLDRQNVELRAEIHGLKFVPFAQEEMIRRELGYVRKNEVLIDVR